MARLVLESNWSEKNIPAEFYSKRIKDVEGLPDPDHHAILTKHGYEKDKESNQDYDRYRKGNHSIQVDKRSKSFQHWPPYHYDEYGEHEDNLHNLDSYLSYAHKTK